MFIFPRFTGIVLCSLLFAACAGTPRSSTDNQEGDRNQSATLRVMTYNIRYNTPSDGRNAWPERKDRVAALIKFHGPDLLGVQEATRLQLDDLEARLPEYDWTGVGRDDGQEGGEYSAILYRVDRFEMLDGGTFWLSETPDVVGSKGWDAALPRIATWARFRDLASGKTYLHVNTHFDHIGEVARTESARLLSRRIPEMAGDLPVLLTGDMNSEPTTDAYEALTDVWTDTYVAAGEDQRYGPVHTFTGFEVTDRQGPRIDYIMVSDGITVQRQGVMTDQEQGFYPSDHLPVIADIVVP